MRRLRCLQWLLILVAVLGVVGKQDEREKRKDIVDMAFCGEDDCYAILNITADSTRGEVCASASISIGVRDILMFSMLINLLLLLLLPGQNTRPDLT
jgi:hypothetical protein